MSQSIPADSSGAGAQAAAGDSLDKPLLEVRHRGLLLFAVMTVSICQFFDATIANVALPHMKVSLGASHDSISWVLTSFIMAGAIFTPITGWLSDRVGSRNLFLWSTVMFLVSSAACGAATSLPEMVCFRIIQGISTAFLGPMTQTIMFDVSPPSKQAQTMATFGMIVMVAPISGPFLGGFIVEYLNWRWIYYVNLPIGIPALAVLWWLLPSRQIERRRLDLFGFVWIALSLGALQLMLDRGQIKDWFQSWEIIVEAIAAISALWIFLVHTRSTRTPLFNRELFGNPNFLAALSMMFVLGLANVALSAVLPTMYQTVYHYPVMDSGLLMAPRGFGVIVTSQLTVFLMKRIDYRAIIALGYLIGAYSLWIMTQWSLEMDSHLIIMASFVQGLGMGMIFGPMNLLAFATIRPELRPDGSSLMALVRNLGGSFGISFIVTMLARNQQVSHSDIAANVTPGSIPGVDLPSTLDRMPGIGGGLLGAIDGEVSRQAAMVAYLDNFYAMFWVLLLMAPMPFLLKKSRIAGLTERMPAE
ncbi:MAG: DHA2 family efflux MFS transporter permease subunit [Novosphingobium sp.]|nr:DHA2 family efflux MFS transporter permease subunit [Novosphingobium sp.]MCP5402860.1 DHA2 family efflux MFS transporter permease subunit [Novosphingobium sp.]